MADWLRHMKDGVGAVPKAIVVVSAHWEERAFSVTTGKAPPLLFDYYGFPEHTYQLRYDAPGAPGTGAAHPRSAGRRGFRKPAPMRSAALITASLCRSS